MNSKRKELFRGKIVNLGTDSILLKFLNNGFLGTDEIMSCNRVMLVIL